MYGTTPNRLAVAGVTLRTAAGRTFPEALEETPPMYSVGRISNPSLKTPNSNPSPKRRIENPSYDGSIPPTLVKLNVDGKDIAPDDLITVDASKKLYKIRGVEGLRMQLSLRPVDKESLSITATLHNDGPGPHKVTLIAPSVEPYRLGRRAEDGYYLFPKCGAVFDNRPCSLRERSSRGFRTDDAHGIARGRDEACGGLARFETPRRRLLRHCCPCRDFSSACHLVSGHWQCSADRKPAVGFGCRA